MAVLCVRAVDLRLEGLLLGGNRLPFLRDSQMSCVSQLPRFPGRTRGPGLPNDYSCHDDAFLVRQDDGQETRLYDSQRYITREFLPGNQEIL